MRTLLPLAILALVVSCIPNGRVCSSSADCADDEICLFGDADEGLCVPDDGAPGGGDDGRRDDGGAPLPDAGPGGGPGDGGVPPSDGGPLDGGFEDDGGPVADGGPFVDGGLDGGLLDGGFDGGLDGGLDDAGPLEPPPYDLDSLTAPSEAEVSGELLVHRLTHDVDAEDWFEAPLVSNDQNDFVYVGLVCEGTGTDNVRAVVWSDLDDAPGFQIACGEEEQRGTVNGQAVRGDVDYYVQVSVDDETTPTDVRYNLFLEPVTPLPTAVTGTPAAVVDVPPASADVAGQDFDSITRPSSTGPRHALVSHDVSYPAGDREDWFPARITTNNQQNFVAGELLCEGIEGTPSPSPLRATLYKDDEPTSVHLFCNQDVQQSSIGADAVQLNDVLHWRVFAQEAAISSQTRISYTLH